MENLLLEKKRDFFFKVLIEYLNAKFAAMSELFNVEPFEDELPSSYADRFGMVRLIFLNKF